MLLIVLAIRSGAITQVILLTGCRLTEISEARWNEFSQSTFTIPASRFKSNEVHTIPLTDQMKELLAEIPRWKGDCLFSANGNKPVAGFAGSAKLRLNRKMTLSWRAIGRMSGVDRRGATPPNWTHHDLRRTMRTRLSGLRVPEMFAEMCIGHVRKGLSRNYDLHRYSAKDAEALTAWSNALSAIVEPPPAPSNVVRLRDAS